MHLELCKTEQKSSHAHVTRCARSLTVIVSRTSARVLMIEMTAAELRSNLSPVVCQFKTAAIKAFINIKRQPHRLH